MSKLSQIQARDATIPEIISRWRPAEKAEKDRRYLLELVKEMRDILTGLDTECCTTHFTPRLRALLAKLEER